ncbi:hypothetical protein GF325_09870, partial [Candidatus Bathyarchaeota archaeon]|nr:hypothetical protein [Candidatus Bathyarchaeota archaeon]
MKESPLSLTRSLVPFISYMMLSGGSGYGFFAFAPQLLEMHVNEGLVSLILLFQPAMIMGFSTLFGRISDKQRNRKKL